MNLNLIVWDVLEEKLSQRCVVWCAAKWRQRSEVGTGKLLCYRVSAYEANGNHLRSAHASCYLCYLPRQRPRVSRFGQQYTCWFSGSNSRSDEIAKVRWHHNRRRFHPFCDRDIGNLGRTGFSPRHGDRLQTVTCYPRTTVNSVSSSASFGGNSTRQRLLRNGNSLTLGLSGQWDLTWQQY